MTTGNTAIHWHIIGLLTLHSNLKLNKEQLVLYEEHSFKTGLFSSLSPIEVMVVQHCSEPWCYLTPLTAKDPQHPCSGY